MDKNKILQQFKAARAKSTPLLCVTTPDPAETVRRLASTAKPEDPLIAWDCLRGPYALNEASERALASLGDLAALRNPVNMLNAAHKLPAQSVLFMQNLHRFISEAVIVQGIWNLRDPFKTENRRTLVILCPSINLPPELTQDVVTLNEPLPDPQDLAAIVKDQFSAAQQSAPDMPAPTEEIIRKAVDATTGLSAFSAEQQIAMSLSKTGLNLDDLWERKRQTIEQTPGLSVWRGGETFADLGGLGNIKLFLSRLLDGKKKFRGIVWFDEIEKAFAGASSKGDSSGVSQEMLATILSWMQDNNVKGIILIGPGGSGKSAIGKAAGNTINVPTIKFDLTAMKDAHIGVSGSQLRNSLSVIDAVTQKDALFIATCNSIGALPPELRRRFSRGTFFCDIPTKDEREAIWTIYLKKFAIKKQPRPDDTDWTGFEVQQCCELADSLECTLKEAAEYIVPVAKSGADELQALRTMASGRYISASTPGIYRHEKQTAAAAGRRNYEEE